MKNPTVQTTTVCGAELSRRGFLKTGGVLIAGFGVLKVDAAEAAAAANSLNASLPESWIEILSLIHI